MPLHTAPATTAVPVDANAMVSVAAPELGVRDLAREQVEAILGNGAEDLPSRVLSDHALRLRGCLRPLCREVEDGVDEGERVVADVLKALDADGPAGLMDLRVRAVRLARGVQVLLNVLDGADPADVFYERPGELNAEDVREAIRLARSWQESGIAPHPGIVRDVVVRLRDAIGVLVPQAEFYRVGLPLSSPVRRAVRDLSAEAEYLAAADVPTVPADAVAYAAGLGGYAHRLLLLVLVPADGDSEQPVPAPFKLASPIAPPVPVRKQPAGERS